MAKNLLIENGKKFRKMAEELQEKQQSISEETVEETINEVSELEQLQEELKSEKEKYIRLFAEFDNFKKRTSKERIDIFKRANQELMVSLLPVLDDFERAIKEIKKQEESDELLKGVELIQNKFIETLIGKGLKRMETAEGDDFDTDLHEAITQIPAPNEDLKNKIIDVTEAGYLLNDNPIRFAKVVVGA